MSKPGEGPARTKLNDLSFLHAREPRSQGAGAGDDSEDDGGDGEDGVDWANLGDELKRFGDDPLIADALKAGGTGNVRHYAKKVEADLRRVEKESIMQYVHESSSILQLHVQMRSCDAILASYESMLVGFERDLGKLGVEIKGLNEKASVCIACLCFAITIHFPSFPLAYSFSAINSQFSSFPGPLITQ
jgi:hypothetical protein